MTPAEMLLPVSPLWVYILYYLFIPLCVILKLKYSTNNHI